MNVLNSGKVFEMIDSNDPADGKPSPITACNLEVLGTSDKNYVNTIHPNAGTPVKWQVILTEPVKVKTALIINDKWSYENTVKSEDQTETEKPPKTTTVSVSFDIYIGNSADDYTSNLKCQESV